MEITEVRVKLVARPSERLRAFCSITLDGDFVIRDLKIIGGSNGAFVAMPSRKLADRCSKCGCKNHLRAKYCNECGQRLQEGRAPKDGQGRAKLHADIAHPINTACRERIQAAVIAAYEAESERSRSPDYTPPKYDDFDEDEEALSVPGEAPPEPQPVSSRREEGEDGGFSDYDSLIADLKREAAGRQTERRTGERARQELAPRTGRPRETERSDQVGTEAPPARDLHHEQAATQSPGAEKESAASQESSAPAEAPVSPPPAPPAPASAPSPAPPPKSDGEAHDGFGAGVF